MENEIPTNKKREKKRKCHFLYQSAASECVGERGLQFMLFNYRFICYKSVLSFVYNPVNCKVGKLAAILHDEIK